MSAARTATAPPDAAPPDAGAELSVERSWSLADIAAVIGLAALGAGLAFYKLDAKNLAADEATSYFIAQLDLGGLWRSIATSEANASLFYTILHFWLGFGESELAIRALPMIAGAGTVPVVYLLAARLFGRPLGLVAAVLLAVNAFFIAHVQELRGYSMSAFLVTLASLAFVVAVQRPSALRWAAYAVVASLSLYAHFFGALVLLAHLASLAFLGPERPPLRNALASFAAIAVLGSPLAYFILFNDVGQVDWIPRLTGERAVNHLQDLAGTGGALLLAAYSAALVLTVVGVVVAMRRRRGSFEAFKYILVALWVLFPIAGALAISLFKPLFISRYLLVSLPGIALAGTAGISVLRFKPLCAAAAAALVALTGAQLGSWYAQSPGLDWEERADWVLENTRPEDAAIFYAPTVIRPFGYYAGYYTEHEASSNAAPPVIYPGIGWLGYSATRYRPSYDAIRAAVTDHPRVWLVAGYARDKPRQRERTRLEDVLADTCSGLLGTWFGGTVKLYVGCDAAE